MIDFTQEKDVRQFIESEVFTMIGEQFVESGGVEKFGYLIVSEHPDMNESVHGPAHSMFLPPTPMMVDSDKSKIIADMKKVAEKGKAIGAIFVTAGTMVHPSKADSKVDIIMIYSEHKLMHPIRYRAVIDKGPDGMTMSPFQDITKTVRFKDDGFRFLKFEDN